VSRPVAARPRTVPDGTDPVATKNAARVPSAILISKRLQTPATSAAIRTDWRSVE